jgi:signal peptidase I
MTDGYITMGAAHSMSNAGFAELMATVLQKGAPFRFKASGGSMSPFIRDGDVISIASLDQKGPRVGDVVAFTHPDKEHLFVHRVVGKHQSTFLIQGDNPACSPDGLIPAGDLIGKVIKVERDGRTVVFGIGPERVLIAYFSRVGLLSILLKLKVALKRIRS